MSRTRITITLALSAVMAAGALAYPALGTTPVGAEVSEVPEAPEVSDEATPQPLSSVLGVHLPTTPHVSPGDPLVHDEVGLEDLRGHLRAGDDHRAMLVAERIIDTRRWGRDRAIAWLVKGLLHRDLGEHNQASEAFTQVRLSKGPLAPWGAWYEAEQDLARGKPWVAIRECSRYRDAWPEGPHADACLRLMARTHASEGRLSTARTLASDYDSEHKDAPIGEQVELAWATWAVEHEPEGAVRVLRELAVEHSAPLTGRVAEELLAELHASGVEGATIPDDDTSLMRRAISLRDARRKDAAWEVFSQIIERSADNPRLARWVDQEASVFGWRTRQWDFLLDVYAQDYEEQTTGENCWRLYRAQSRAGHWADAAQTARLGLDKHGGTRHWYRSHEEVGRTMMMVGSYEEARDLFERVKARGGWTGRRGAFFAAFSAYMSGDLDDALARFDAILEEDRSYQLESHYWRSRTLERLDRSEEAQADRLWIAQNEPWSWYGTLLQQSDPEQPVVHPFARDGRWPGAELPDLPEPPTAVLPEPEIPVAGWVRPRELHGSVAFALLRWPMPPAVLPETEAEPLVRAIPQGPPESYSQSVFYDEAEVAQDLWSYSEKHKESWPEVAAARDLAAGGLYDLSGPLFASFYEDWRAASRSRYQSRHAAAKEAWLKPEDWRPFFLFTRDHNHSARFTHGLEEEVEDPALKAELLRLSMPLAHDRYVWTHAREHDIDPYMVMGLMRTESTYNPLAVSRAGARGAMQIMPRTGHLLSDLAHDTDFTAGDLDDPVQAVGLGITYLGLLMERYDHAFPLAIASYNAGPHNVSAWLDGTGYSMPMDELVEHIPFRETRRYVKKVSTSYAGYLALYAPEGTRIVVPESPRGNHPEIVDF